MPTCPLALESSGVPQEAAELCEDPDAARGTFNHWVLPSPGRPRPGWPRGASGRAVEGRNHFGKEGDGARCRRSATAPHRYFFRLYAAAAPLELVAGASADDLRRALEGVEMASGTLVGTYQR